MAITRVFSVNKLGFFWNLIGFMGLKNNSDEFALKHRRENTLPLSTIDCKLLEYPWPNDRHYKYELNSMVIGNLSKSYLPLQKSLISAQTLEMTNYALNPTQVKRVAKSKKEIDPKDLVFLTPKGSSDTQKSRPIVPWLRRTEYVSSENRQYGKASTTAKAKYALQNTQLLELHRVLILIKLLNKEERE